jgi:peptide/nickel transport system permease protein
MYLRYIVARAGTFVLVVWVAMTLNFILPRMAPGNPIDSIRRRWEETGSSMSEAQVAELMERFGLNEPLISQYWHYLVRSLQFDFGPSLSAYPRPVSELIMQSLGWSVGLLTFTTLLSFVLGCALGALYAWRRGRSILKGITSALIIISPLPYYLLAIVVLFVFAITLGWFPVTAAGAYTYVTSWNWSSISAAITYAFLPALSIILAATGAWALTMRAMMTTTKSEDYITYAQASGISERRILWKYAARNASLPVVTQLAIALGSVAGGAVLVEVIFQYPGVGTTLVNAIRNHDYPTIQGLTFVTVVTVAFGVLLIDLMYPLLDPRVKADRGAL